MDVWAVSGLDLFFENLKDFRMEEGVFFGAMGVARIFSATSGMTVSAEVTSTGVSVLEADFTAPGTPATAAAISPAGVGVLVVPASVLCASSVGAASVANEEARAAGAGEGARAGAGAGVLDPKKEENHPPEDFWPDVLTVGVVGGFWARGAGTAGLGAVGAASAFVAAGTSTDSSLDCATPLGALSPAFGVTFDTLGVAFTSTEGLGSPPDLGVLGTSFSFPSPPCPMAAAAALSLMTRMYFPH